jgi:hypothetical protein
MTDSDSAPGVFRLHQFEPKIETWRDEERPPADLVARVEAWWPCLQHNPRAVGNRVPGKPGVRYVWVADCFRPDDDGRTIGVQCHYRIDGKRVICQFFATAAMGTVAEDR